MPGPTVALCLALLLAALLPAATAQLTLPLTHPVLHQAAPHHQLRARHSKLVIHHDMRVFPQEHGSLSH